ncbi:hypothetical protein F2Q70_00027218 [Brassica cretica]|uniref:Uncharacterized protein n=1 Tax=Brassica cretica TaxID=69181 RepID=A0A8S9LC08_BRACR|nr:hypothetical protein F2Q70_00027218 [Brassica cretica]
MSRTVANTPSLVKRMPPKNARVARAAATAQRATRRATRSTTQASSEAESRSGAAPMNENPVEVPNAVNATIMAELQRKPRNKKHDLRRNGDRTRPPKIGEPNGLGMPCPDRTCPGKAPMRKVWTIPYGRVQGRSMLQLWRSPLRVQPQERQQAKPCPSITPPPPSLAAAAPPPSKPAAGHHPRSPSRRTRASSRRLLDSVSCKQLRSEPQGKIVISSSMSLGMTDPKPISLL